MYNPEEIIEMANKLLEDISTSDGNVDMTMTINYVDRCVQLVKNLAESISELHQRVDIITEKD